MYLNRWVQRSQRSLITKTNWYTINSNLIIWFILHSSFGGAGGNTKQGWSQISNFEDKFLSGKVWGHRLNKTCSRFSYLTKSPWPKLLIVFVFRFDVFVLVSLCLGLFWYLCVWAVEQLWLSAEVSVSRSRPRPIKRAPSALRLINLLCIAMHYITLHNISLHYIA